ncbi:MAG: hypothetical protein HQ518_14915 [Rhodopirellula sp.]|nr:hypothetical protein [Rhodopirellula sp.]
MTEPSNVTRRDFGKAGVQSLLTLSLLETIFARDAWSAEVSPITAKWLAGLNELAGDVKEQRISQVVWQKKVEELYSQIEVDELMKFVDFKSLTKDLKFVDHGARSLRPKFPDVEGLPKELVFGRQIFAIKKGQSVVPHGHNNMATAFLVLKGDLHGRHYDRIEDEAKHLIIRPTIDQQFKPGGTSTVSDYKDNIHWFKATSDSAFIFNIHVLGVRPGSALPTGRVYVDPNGESLADGLVRARRLNYDEAHKLFG